MDPFIEFLKDHQSHDGTAESLVIGFLLQTIEEQHSANVQLQNALRESELDRGALIDAVEEAYGILHKGDRTPDQRLWAILALVDALYESFVGPLPLPPVESGLTPAGPVVVDESSD